MPIYCDIDGTLTDKPHHSHGAPRPDVIQRLKDAIKLGHEVVLWSGRGSTYVKSFAIQYGIDAIACLSKPTLVVDDKPDIRHLPGDVRYKPITPEEFLKKDLK